MCGNVGVLSTKITPRVVEVFKQLLVIDMVRGRDGTGIAKVDTAANTSEVFKGAGDAFALFKKDGFDDFLTPTNKPGILIGHNRAATMGPRCDKGAHPFIHDHITLAHNGTVDFHALHLLEGSDEKIVDSHMVAMTIAEHGPVKAAREHLSGAFALIWWNSQLRTLNMMRNKERPLHMAATADGSLWWASEAETLEAVLDRKSTFAYTSNDDPSELSVDTLVSWHFNNEGELINKGIPRTTKVAFHEEPTPAFKGWGGSYSGYSNYYGQQQQPSNTTYKYGHLLGTDNYIASRNEMLEGCGYGKRMGDIITFKVATVTQGNTITAVGNGKLKDGTLVEFKCYRSKVAPEVGKRFTGMISATYLNTTNAGKALVILVEDMLGVDLSLEKKKKKEEKDFFLKVDGRLFTKKEEFQDFVSCGCAFCGNVPTVNNIFNKDMAVYPSAHEGKEEFICGACMVDSPAESLPMSQMFNF